jgi:cobalt-zinc-cadmium resistance protein CzcA
MVERIVRAALEHRIVVLLLALALLGTGLFAYTRLDIEAYPNPVPPMVEVLTQPNGWSAEEVERYVTIPLEVGLSGIPGLKFVRSQSLFGLSDVKCYFEWGTDYWASRQEVLNRLQFVTLPQGLQAQISPWNAIGEVFRYTVEGPGYTLDELKTAQDWILERQWRRVPGVIDVVSYGGLTREYHVEVDPFRLRAHRITLAQVTQGIANANMNVGGQRLTLGEQSYDIRGVGMLRNVHDIEDVVVAESLGVPIRVRDIADVHIGAAPRLGMVGQDDHNDVVQGVVLMRYGAETPAVLQGIYERLEYIKKNHLLPPEMVIRPYYDRGDLVHVTTHTVIENMLVGISLVVLVLFLFLGNLRAALVTAINIPLALMGAFIGLVCSGTSANLISLGAVDFGIVVDSTVIMMENVVRHLGPHGSGSMRQRILAAAAEVARPLGFSTLIIGTSFLPLFTMVGVSGVIFSPMARTYALAIGGGIVLALTLTPVLIHCALSPDFEEKENILMRALHRFYDPLFDLALGHPRAATLFRLLPILLCFALFPFLGREFMPKLEEGNLWIRAAFPMSISFEQSAHNVARLRRIVRGCPADPQAPCDDRLRSRPEILSVVSQLGRPDDGTDVTGFFNIELFAPLKPFDEFRAGVSKEKLIEDLTAELQEEFPGVVFNFSQMISDNVEEAIAGVKGENSVKVFGPSVVQNEANAHALMQVMDKVPGVKDLGLFRSLGQPGIQITPNRHACARYGLNTGDVDAVILAAIGGQAVTQVYEGEKSFALTVRWAAAHRQSVEAMRRITVTTPEGINVPLGQLASIAMTDVPATIYRENGQRYAPIKFSVRGRDLAGAIEEAERSIAAQVHLPYDSHLEWAGEIGELRKAQERLMIIVPLSLLLIAFLVYSSVRNGLDTLIVLIDIPVACTGGILALLVTGEHFSVSAAMGFVSIFGIAIQDAILVVTYFQNLHLVEGHTIEKAAREAAEKRFRPVLMTTLVATIGLLPAALSHGIGSQTQRPLAIVVIGGSLIVALLTRVLQPTLLVVSYQWRERRRLARRGGSHAVDGL